MSTGSVPEKPRGEAVPPVPSTPRNSDGPTPPRRRRRRFVLLGVGVLALVAVLVLAVPAVVTAVNTVSTDDAYVNGHVTFVAPRVPGQVLRVPVDDNHRVKAGDL